MYQLGTALIEKGYEKITNVNNTDTVRDVVQTFNCSFVMSSFDRSFIEFLAAGIGIAADETIAGC